MIKLVSEQRWDDSLILCCRISPIIRYLHWEDFRFLEKRAGLLTCLQIFSACLIQWVRPLEMYKCYLLQSLRFYRQSMCQIPAWGREAFLWRKKSSLFLAKQLLIPISWLQTRRVWPKAVPTPPDLRCQKLNRCSLACHQGKKVAEEALSESAGPSLALLLYLLLELGC